MNTSGGSAKVFGPFLEKSVQWPKLFQGLSEKIERKEKGKKRGEKNRFYWFCSLNVVRKAQRALVESRLTAL